MSLPVEWELLDVRDSIIFRDVFLEWSTVSCTSKDLIYVCRKKQKNTWINTVIKIFQISRVSKCVLVIFRNVCTLVSSHLTSKIYPKATKENLFRHVQEDFGKKTVTTAK